MEIEELKREFSQCRGGTNFHHTFEQNCNFNGCECYIYKVHTDHGATFYEGFFRRTAKKRINVDGKTITTDELYVQYPSDNCFGTWAWTSPNLQSLLRTLESKCTR